jgi:hypothetical protein
MSLAYGWSTPAPLSKTSDMFIAVMAQHGGAQRELIGQTAQIMAGTQALVDQRPLRVGADCTQTVHERSTSFVLLVHVRGQVRASSPL